MTDFKRGELVEATVHGGATVTRRVWDTIGAGVQLCSEETYQRALQTGEEPLYVGFPPWDVRPIPLCPARAKQERSPTST